MKQFKKSLEASAIEDRTRQNINNMLRVASLRSSSGSSKKSLHSPVMIRQDFKVGRSLRTLPKISSNLVLSTSRPEAAKPYVSQARISNTKTHKQLM